MSLIVGIRTLVERIRCLPRWFKGSILDRCQRPGCWRRGIECRVPNVFGEYPAWALVEYYCGDHAGPAGYCHACGIFIAGIDDPMSLPFTCESCSTELEADDNPADPETDEPWSGDNP